MSSLTVKEKAKRYDALQVAIKYTVETLQKQRKDCENRYQTQPAGDIIGAYSKGMADACESMIQTLVRWEDE